ncbi:MAG: alkene reductase [Betaproteobacteria bacterium]
MTSLFEKSMLATLPLQNRFVMSPLTRCRALGNVPTDLMVEYYTQRASAGLIISEGTSPSANGIGYARIPGIYSAAQIAGWSKVTAAVHGQGAKMFMQIMHCGRIGHSLNVPAGGQILAPSALAAAGEMWTDSSGMQPNAMPTAMTEAQIKSTVAEYAQGAKNALDAGFDGVELHAANGYLLEQFIRPTSNQRTDAYGGSIENRARFVLEVVDAVVKAVGKDKVGIRLSPFGVFNDMPVYPELADEYAYLAEQLNARGLVYIHLVDHSPMGAPAVPDSIKAMFRKTFKGALILSGGYDAVRADKDIADGRCDLVAFGRPFLANPDFIARSKAGAPMNAPDMDSFYTADAKGYTDYPLLG